MPCSNAICINIEQSGTRRHRSQFGKLIAGKMVRARNGNLFYRNAPEFESTNPPMPNTPSSTAMVTKTPITFRDEPVRALLYREALRTSETLTERKSPSRYPLPCR